MRLNQFIDLAGGVYYVQIGVSGDRGITPKEQDALNKFGEPDVDVGGSFDGSTCTESELHSVGVFSFGPDVIKFPSMFPVKQCFSLVDYPSDANKRARIWQEIVTNRITTAMTTTVGSFVGTTGHNVVDITI
jgi:hypothetical protein